MIRFLKGDIFSSPAQVIVNTVNTVGVMGKGIALEYKTRYPHMFELYRDLCEKKQLNIGELAICYEADHWIMLFPTKTTWRAPSKYEYIEAGLKKFEESYIDMGISSIAFPKLGCGNGELDWERVKKLMTDYLSVIPIDIYIYESNIELEPEHQKIKATEKWLKENARDLSTLGIEEDIRYHYSIAPYEFSYNDSRWQMIWNEGMVFSSSGEKQIISEDEFITYWDDIRDSRIVFENEHSEEFINGLSSEKDNTEYVGSENVKKRELLIRFLFLQGYLTEIQIIDNGRLIRGYQVNEGLGRVYFTRKKAI